MRILITGGAGYIGSTLAPILLKMGHIVRIYDSLLFGVDPILPLFRHPCFDLMQGDIRDGQKLEKAVRDSDVIIHLAAIVGAPACKADPDRAYAVNVTGTRLLESVRTYQPIVFASTGSNYGAVPSGICTEETPLNPLTQYGRTKTEAERALLAAGNVVVYRFATAFGLSPRLRLDLLVNDFVYKALRERYLVMYEASYMRTFLHVHDIAMALVHAVQNLNSMTDQVYNVGADWLNISKADLAALVQEAVEGFYVHVADVGTDEDQRNYQVDYSKITRTGYSPSISLRQGIDEMVTAFQYLSVRSPYNNVG